MATEKAKETKAKKKLSNKEIEAKVVELAKKDVPSSKIGLTLKKEHGISRVKNEAGKVNKILEKQGIKRFPEELHNLINKASRLRVHFKENHKDNVSKRGIQITEAKIRKIATYFKKRKVLEPSWTYSAK